MVNHPNRSRTPEATISMRVLEAARRINDLASGRPLGAGSPPEHEAAWRRLLLAFSTEPPVINGREVDFFERAILLDSWQLLRASAIEAGTDPSGAILVLCRRRDPLLAASIPTEVSEALCFELERGGWQMLLAMTEGTKAGGPLVFPEGAMLRLPGGAWCNLRQRTERRAGEVGYAMEVLPLADQWRLSSVVWWRET